MPTAKPTAPRKRNRKRKRRLASSSSSSDSSDSSSDEISTKTPVQKAPLKKQATPSSVEESSSSPSPSSSDSENDDVPFADAPPTSSAKPQQPPDSVLATTRHRSPSPSPAPANAPPFLPPEGSNNREQDEQALRDRFRQFWMASVADAFGDDLEQIRKVRTSTSTVYPQNRVYPRPPHAGAKGAGYDPIAPSSADRLACFWQRSLLVPRG